MPLEAWVARSGSAPGARGWIWPSGTSEGRSYRASVVGAAARISLRQLRVDGRSAGRWWTHPRRSRQEGVGGVRLAPRSRAVKCAVREVVRGPTPGPAALTYNPAAGGGTTTLEFDVNDAAWVSGRLSLGGTVRNCAGGPTPWRSTGSPAKSPSSSQGRTSFLHH